MNLSESPFSGQTVRKAGVLAAGLMVGSTGVRRFRVQVSGHSDTCDAGMAEVHRGRVAQRMGREVLVV
ncbi:MAG: hypothetical protein JWN00_2599 [Actinomycetia bacterium]|jgi:hypothetical protein|nr:hypothetical protein [Actinomycetes bacterium]